MSSETRIIAINFIEENKTILFSEQLSSVLFSEASNFARHFFNGIFTRPRIERLVHIFVSISQVRAVHVQAVCCISSTRTGQRFECTKIDQKIREQIIISHNKPHQEMAMNNPTDTKVLESYLDQPLCCQHLTVRKVRSSIKSED